MPQPPTHAQTHSNCPPSPAMAPRGPSCPQPPGTGFGGDPGMLRMGRGEGDRVQHRHAFGIMPRSASGRQSPSGRLPQFPLRGRRRKDRTAWETTPAALHPPPFVPPLQQAPANQSPSHSRAPHTFPLPAPRCPSSSWAGEGAVPAPAQGHARAGPKAGTCRLRQAHGSGSLWGPPGRDVGCWWGSTGCASLPRWRRAQCCPCLSLAASQPQVLFRLQVVGGVRWGLPFSRNHHVPQAQLALPPWHRQTEPAAWAAAPRRRSSASP